MKRFFNILMSLFLLVGMLCIASGVYADTLDIIASDLSYATDGVAPDHSYKIVQLRAGQAAGFDVSLGEMMCKSVAVSFRTGNTEAGILELHLESPEGELIGEFNAADYSPRDWATILTANVKLKTSISGKSKVFIVNKNGTHTIHGLSFELYDPNAVIRNFSVLDNELFGEEHTFSAVSVKLLSQFGILPENFDKSKPVSRLEFASMLGKVIDSEQFAYGDNPFADVPLENANCKVLTGLYNLGIVKGSGNGNFRPDELIKPQEVSSICLNALGYSGLYDYESALSFASKLKLFKDINISDGYICGDDAAGVLCNLFTTQSLEIGSVKDGSAGYEKSKNFIERNTSVYYGEGIVTSNYDTSLFKANDNIQKTITIDNVEFFPGDTDGYGYIGIMCKYFYRIEKGKKLLVAMYPSDDCDVEVYKTSLTTALNEVSSDSIIIENDGEERKYNLTSQTSVIYNGISTNDPISSLISPDDFTGTVTIIKNGNSKNVDCIWIDNAYNFLISDIGLDVIVDKVTGNVLEHTADNFFVYREGTDISSDELSVGDVLTVYESENLSGVKLIRAIADQKSISGEVSETSDDIIIIEGEKYLVSDYCDKSIVPGTSALFKLNDYSQVVDLDEETARKFSVGLYMGYEEKNNGFTDEYKVKLLTQEKGVSVFEFSSKPLIDGVRIKENSYLKRGFNKFIGMVNIPANTPVLYNIDSDGKVVMLDTVEIGADNDDDTLTQLGEGDDWLTLNRILIDNSWKYRHPLSNNAKFIYTTSDKNEDNYAIENGFSSPDDRVSAIPYSTKKDSIIADIIFAQNYSYSLNQGKEPFVFEKLTRGVNASGDTAVYICGYNSTGKVKYEVDEASYVSGSVLKWGVDSLRPGALVQVSLTRSMVTWLDIIYLPGGERKNQSGYGAHIYEDGPYKVYGTYGTMFYGNVLGVEDGFIKIGFDDGEYVSYLVDGKMLFWTLTSNGRLQTTVGKSSSLAINDEKVILYIASGKAKAIYSYRDSLSE